MLKSVRCFSYANWIKTSEICQEHTDMLTNTLSRLEYNPIGSLCTVFSVNITAYAVFNSVQTLSNQRRLGSLQAVRGRTQGSRYVAAQHWSTRGASEWAKRWAFCTTPAMETRPRVLVQQQLCQGCQILPYTGPPSEQRLLILMSIRHRMITHLVMLADGHCRRCCPGTLASMSSHCNSFEDRGIPIFKWVAVTWLNDKVPA